MRKKYQPERTDLFINTDWGIPRAGATPEEVRSKKLLLFHDRWVTKEEKKRLKDEQGAYVSIRIIGYLLLFICVPVLINIRSIAAEGIGTLTVAVLYALIASAIGSGLIRFARYARYPAVLLFLSFFILPFLPVMESEKGAPLMFILGAAGLYYLLRRTARRILWPAKKASAASARIRPAVRMVVYAIALIAGLSAGYFIYDVNRAKRMAADACVRAKPGTQLEDYLASLSSGDYKVVRSAHDVSVVPKSGMGRYFCSVSHDGRYIVSAQKGFRD